MNLVDLCGAVDDSHPQFRAFMLWIGGSEKLRVS